LIDDGVQVLFSGFALGFTVLVFSALMFGFIDFVRRLIG
jgi:hypothetical protein